jgi:hypothetical protein
MSNLTTIQGMDTSRFALLLTLTGLIAGCSRSATYVTPDGKVLVQQSGKRAQGQVAHTGKEVNTVILNTQTGKLPDDYPKDVPLPGDAKVVMSTSASDARSFFVALESAAAADSLVAFYKKGLADNGWTIESTTPIAGMARFAASKDKRQLTVSIGDQDGKRIVSQTVVTKN